jgi:hypothetical protein
MLCEKTSALSLHLFFFKTNFWMQHFDGARLSPNSVRNAVWHASNEPVCQYLRTRNTRCSTVYIFTHSSFDCLKIWEPQPPGTLRACNGFAFPFAFYTTTTTAATGDQNNSVGIATSYGLDGPEIESQWGGEIFRTRPDRPLGSTKPPIQWVPGLSQGVKRSGVVLIPHPHLQCPGLKLGRAISLPTLWALVACQRENLYYYYYYYYYFVRDHLLV